MFRGSNYYIVVGVMELEQYKTMASRNGGRWLRGKVHDEVNAALSGVHDRAFCVPYRVLNYQFSLWNQAPTAEE